MKCPKCGKLLKKITIKGDNWLGHSYTLLEVMRDVSMCDYSIKVRETPQKGVSTRINTQ